MSCPSCKDDCRDGVLGVDNQYRETGLSKVESKSVDDLPESKGRVVDKCRHLNHRPITPYDRSLDASRVSPWSSINRSRKFSYPDLRSGVLSMTPILWHASIGAVGNVSVFYHACSGVIFQLILGLG